MFDSENFMRTGDVGYFDKKLNLYIVDRVKELIKVMDRCHASLCRSIRAIRSHRPSWRRFC